MNGGSCKPCIVEHWFWVLIGHSNCGSHSRNGYLTPQDKPKHFDGLTLFTGLALEMVAVMYGVYVVYVGEFIL